MSTLESVKEPPPQPVEAVAVPSLPPPPKPVRAKKGLTFKFSTFTQAFMIAHMNEPSTLMVTTHFS